MDKTLVELLSSLLPKEHIAEISTTVKTMLDEAKAEIEAEKEKEYEEKLEAAYAELAQEMKEAEKVAEQGYNEAWTIIYDLRNRLETQQAEFEKTLEENYEEAYQMLLAERAKNEELELKLYEDSQKRLAEMKAYIVEKLNEFLLVKGQEIYEQARRDVLSDPRIAEHKLALDRVVEIVSTYLSDEDFNGATSSKLEEASKLVEQLKAQQRILEAKNIRLSTENHKLTEEVRKAADLITESKTTVKKEEKKEAVRTAKNVQGRGQMYTEGIIPEPKGDAKKPKKAEGDTTLVEQFGDAALHQMKVLSGLASDEE